MNLITRIILLFAAISMIVFLVGGVISYRVMKREVDAEQRRFLVETLDRWTNIIGRMQPEDTLRRRQVLVVPLDDLREERIEFSDTLAMHIQLERLEPHLKVRAIRNIDGRSYDITLIGLIIESDDIVDAVTESLLKIYLILLGVIILIGGFASYLIFNPFRKTLEIVKNFSIKTPQSNEFPKSSVAEFKKLNAFLTEMTSKVQTDYSSLKEFSENASHELQTPLAIAQTKLELLLDQDPLTEKQTELITQAQAALKRMSKLSSSLGILTRIDNLEYDEVQKIDLSGVTNSILREFSELIELRKISLSTQIADEISVNGDKTLIEMMISNLISNAIRHNIPDGAMNITLSQSEFRITNSGLDLDFDPNQLFERFRKSNQSNHSIGLGLAIVKQICDRYDFTISYHQKDGEHSITIGL